MMTNNITHKYIHVCSHVWPLPPLPPGDTGGSEVTGRPRTRIQVVVHVAEAAEHAPHVWPRMAVHVQVHVIVYHICMYM